MKKFIAVILALILVVSPLYVNVQVNTVSAENILDKIELTEDQKMFRDRFVNRLIEFVNYFLIAIRYPWKAKGDNRVDMSKFTLTFAEDFDAKKLDRSLWWNYHEGRRKGGYWDKSQSFIKDGNLIIRAEYKEEGEYGAGYYCDRVLTRGKFEQTYGYFECRCILPAAKGLWAAFWLSTENVDDFVPGTEGTEIDVFESPFFYRGEKGKENGLITCNLHYGGYELGHRYKNVNIVRVPDPYVNYNTYGLEWNEKEYIFYINGIETGRSSFGGVSRVPEFLELSVEIDGARGEPYQGWSGIITDNDPDVLPADFIVDYVHVYQYNDILNTEAE